MPRRRPQDKSVFDDVDPSRRIRLATRAPLQALWDAIGSAGNPPRDQSRKFAVVAILVTTLTWFVVPAALAIVFLT